MQVHQDRWVWENVNMVTGRPCEIIQYCCCRNPQTNGKRQGCDIEDEPRGSEHVQCATEEKQRTVLITWKE